MGKARRIPCGEREHASPSCPLNPRRGHLQSRAAPAALAADLEVKICYPPLLPSRLSLSWRLSLPGRLRACAAGSLGTWDPSRGRRSRLPLLPAARRWLEAGAGEVTVKAFVCTWIQRSKDFPRRCVWPFGGAFFLFNSFFFPEFQYLYGDSGRGFLPVLSSSSLSSNSTVPSPSSYLLGSSWLSFYGWFQ